MNTFNETDPAADPGDPESSSPSPREAARRSTRRSVLEAARTTFEARGFEDPGIRDIAQAAGVSPGTVLHHFGSKRELLYAAFFDDLEGALQGAVAAAHETPEADFEARLASVAASIFRSYRRRPELSRVFLRESLMAEPPWDARFQGQMAELHAAIVELGAQARTRGELPADLDLPLLGLAWISFYTFALLAWAQGAPGVSADPEGVMARQMAQHLDGLRLPPSDKAPS